MVESNRCILLTQTSPLDPSFTSIVVLKNARIDSSLFIAMWSLLCRHWAVVPCTDPNPE